ncbi:hypothetical protein LX32DRAFT_687297 [Colletotrichum zoysiae]|uniref:Uncharacterized protein n=1 Tax=Colletotrichum zoysiae TaxID=1216348 RepID=A0AAD9LV22_9PEZI|nr:hypothetical protein LX32DRAFT_687297 [Colletotrichum zoysiae]
MSKPRQPDVTYNDEQIYAVYKSVQKTPWTGLARVTPNPQLVKKEAKLKSQVTFAVGTDAKRLEANHLGWVIQERNKLCDKTYYPVMLSWRQADLFANFCGMEGNNMDEFLRIMVEKGHIQVGRESGQEILEGLDKLRHYVVRCLLWVSEKGFILILNSLMCFRTDV